MKKKLMNRLISLLVVPCLVTGPMTPVAQLSWFSVSQTSQVYSAETVTEPSTDNLTDPTEQVPVTELTVTDIQRDQDGWASAAVYTITLGGDLTNVDTVTIVGTGEQELQTLSGNGDGTYSATITANGTYTVTVTQKDGEPITIQIVEEHIDAIAPGITQTSIPAEGWQKNMVYTFMVSDDLSQVTGVTVLLPEGTEVELTSSEDGSYRFTAEENGSYTATVRDMAGNEASVSFEIANIDATAPEISQPVRSAEGWAQEVIYSFGATDTASGIGSVTVQPQGEEVVVLTPSEDGNYCFAASANTVYTVTVTDMVGNVAQVTVTDSSIDRIAPVISAVVRETDGWAQEALYTFTVQDGESGVAFVKVKTPDGKLVALSANTSGAYQFTCAANGEYTILAEDAVGNRAETTFLVDQIDTDVPEISQPERGEPGWMQEVEYQFTVKDTTSDITGVTVTPIGAAAFILTPDENGVYCYIVQTNGTYTITVTDAAGNTTTTTFTENQIDCIAPVFSDIQREKDGWTQNTVGTFTVTDSDSGIAYVTLAFQGDEREMTPNKDGSYSFTVSDNGEYVITAYDCAGNSTVINYSENRIDTAAPEISDVLRKTEGWAQEAVYTFTVSDIGSGMGKVTVSLQNGEIVVLTPDAYGSYNFAASSNEEYVITAVDAIGNTSSKTFAASNIDTAAPVISGLTRQTQGWAQEAVYAFDVLDDLSGIASVIVRDAAGKEISTTANGGSYSFTATENTVYTVTVVDVAGNKTEQTVEERKIDRSAPVLKVIGRIQDSWQQAADHVFTVEDTASGIQTIIVLYDGKEVPVKQVGDGSYRFTANANGVYTVVVTDMVGNEVRQDVKEHFIDLIAPEISDVQPQQTWDSEANTITMTVTDDCELASVKITDAQGNNCPFIQSGSAVSLTVNANGTYTVEAVDAAGNKTTQKFVVDHIDTQAPTAPVLSANGTGFWVNVDVIMDAASTDTQSGVKEYWYSADSKVYGEGVWNQMSFTEGTGSLRLTEDMDRTYYVVAIDGVGRVSAASEIRVQIDKTPAETVTLDHVTGTGSGYLRQVNGKLLYVDLLTFSAMAIDSASGVVRYEYKVLGASGSDTDWISVNAGSEGIIEVFQGAEDHYTISVRVYDLAGNCTEAYITEDCILENTHTEDRQRNPMPGVKINAEEDIYDSTWTKETLTITVSGSSSVSGIEYYEYMVDHADPAKADLNWTKIPVVEGAAQLTADRDTNATYYFRAVSYAGNTSCENSAEIHIQKSTPVAATLTTETATGNNGWYTVLPEYAVILPAQGEYFAPVQYLFTVTHDGQQQAEVIYDGSNAPKVSDDGLWSIRITAIDAAGNTATKEYSALYFSVDTKAPSKLDVTMDGGSILNISTDGKIAWENVVIADQVLHSDFTIFKPAGVTIQAVADGGDSGLASIYYQVTAKSERYDQNGTWTPLAADGLRLTPDSKNHLYFKAVDMAGNTTFFSGASLLIDATLPETGTTFTDVNCSVHGFYNGNVTVDVHVEEPVTGNDRVFAGLSDIQYRVFRDGEQTQQGQLWPGSGATVREQERVLSWNGSFVVTGELNNSNDVVVEIIVTDMAGNISTFTSNDGELRIDMTAPEIRGSYDRNDPVVFFNEQGCFTGNRVLTVSVTERNFIPEESFVLVVDTDTGREEIYAWMSDGMTHMAQIPVTADGHYTVSASITDAAGNVTQQILFEEGTAAADNFVIDNTPSEIRVSYSNQDVRNDMYFDASRTLTVTVTERNFDTEKVTAKIYFTAENGTEKVMELTQWHSDGNTHTATMKCSTDGIYRIEVTGTDALDNPANPTAYTGAASEHWVLDTYIDSPTLDYVVNGMAYNGQIVPQVTVLDTNLDGISMTLLRTRMNEIDVDVTELLLTPDKVVYQNVEGGKTVGLDIFPMEEGMDGRYTLTVNCVDKAGNTASSTVMFYANRFGSVYAYSDYLVSLLNGYFTEITEDIVITEYNPSGVLDGSSVVQITVDGVPVTDPAFEVAGTPSGEVGESGWYEYIYTIPCKNFAQDGVYSVVVSSKDTAGNVPENMAEDMAISFAVDTTAPTLPIITGLEESIMKADSIEVTLSAMDNVMLDSITVYLNGEVLENWTQINSYSGEWKFTIPAGLEQTVRIVVVDKTGNTLDTDAEGFTPGYGFNRTITVSTNFFLRLYANRPLFIGVVVGTSVLVIGGIILIILLAKKRKNKANQ